MFDWKVVKMCFNEKFIFSDDLVDWCVEMIKFAVDFGLDLMAKYPWVWQIGATGFGLVAITALIAIVKAGRSKPVKQTKKDKKSK